MTKNQNGETNLISRRHAAPGRDHSVTGGRHYPESPGGIIPLKTDTFIGIGEHGGVGFGWVPQGERRRASIPFGHWKTTTLIAALRFDRIDAPMTIDGALDGEAFLATVEQVLGDAVAGETVVLDNVPVHKVAGVREAIAAKGAGLLYLPTYSPDSNPIEKSFSKIKSVLQRIAARTADGLQTAVGEALGGFTPDE